MQAGARRRIVRPGRAAGVLRPARDRRVWWRPGGAAGAFLLRSGGERGRLGAWLPITSLDSLAARKPLISVYLFYKRLIRYIPLT